MNPADPFSSRFEVFGRDRHHDAVPVNQGPFEELRKILETGGSGDGRVILLRAPRAGYGKTSLLQRLADELAEDYQFVRINLAGGRTTDAAHVLEYVLQSLCQVLPGSATLTRLDMLARGVLSLGLEPLVASGEVPCQDPEGALAAMRENPAETFDFHHDQAVTAHWTKSNFEILGPRLAAELARESGASLREASYWVELLFRFATTPPDNVERARLLYETIFRSDLQSQPASAAEERLHGLLSLCSTVIRPVLVVDDTEGLSTSPADALALTSFLSNISQSCPGTTVILSVNDDIWDSAFLPCLPGGLSDRLLEDSIVLEPLSRKGAEALVSGRSPERGSEVISAMAWPAGDESLYARQVLRLASEAWSGLRHTDREPAALGSDKEADRSSPAAAGRQELDIDDPLAELPDFEEIPPRRRAERTEAETAPRPDAPTIERSVPVSDAGDKAMVPAAPPTPSEEGEGAFEANPVPEPTETIAEEPYFPTSTERAQQLEKSGDTKSSFVRVGNNESDGGDVAGVGSGAASDEGETFLGAEAPFEPSQQEGLESSPSEPVRKDPFPSADRTKPVGEDFARPRVSQPISPFVAVAPPHGISEGQGPSVNNDPATDQADRSDLSLPEEMVYSLGDEVAAPPGPSPAGGLSPTASDVDPDPTRGEIEFAKLKPLSEKPPLAPAGASQKLVDDQAAQPDPASPQPRTMEPAESPFTAVIPDSPPSATPATGSIFTAVPPAGGGTSPGEDPGTTFVPPVAPQAAAPSSSPFAPVDAGSEGTIEADSRPAQPSSASPVPAQPSPFDPEGSPAPPSSWWPGDNPGRPAGSEKEASPFVSVGSQTGGPPPQGRIEPEPGPGSSSSSTSDKEEVDKLLRQLREGGNSP